MSNPLQKDTQSQQRSYEQQLEGLIGEFDDQKNSQSEKLGKLAKQAEQNNNQLQKNIDRLQELLDYLRVCIKYRAFDIEATRRENEYLRKLLEEADERGDDETGC